MSSTTCSPRVLLFDIGGVCVGSPFQAILDYEKRHGIPLGYINHAISASGPDGAWAKLERGDVLADQAFFRAFTSDLRHERRWREYCARRWRARPPGRVSRGQAAGGGGGGGAEEEEEEEEHAVPPPAVPDVDGERLYGEMMRVAREPDPHMWPALQRLRTAADESRGALVLGALSNTSLVPPGHPLADASTPEASRDAELKRLFDVFVSSAHVGMRKPHEDIYRYAMVRLHEHVRRNHLGPGVRPQDITFIDDIGANLKTAKKMGMNTIKVTLGRADLAVEELEKLTGLKLKGDHPRL